jgi:thiol-disulfide isomerase/thioredoxin
VKDKNGQDYTIGAPGDDVVVVVFFTTWCQCCPDVLRSLDLLIKTLENMKITNVKIIALNIGNEPLPALESYYSSNGIKDLRVYCSIPLASVDKDVSGVPAFRVYSKTGKQIWTHVGAVQCNSDEFINLIEGLSKRGDK